MKSKDEVGLFLPQDRSWNHRKAEQDIQHLGASSVMTGRSAGPPITLGLGLCLCLWCQLWATPTLGMCRKGVTTHMFPCWNLLLPLGAHNEISEEIYFDTFWNFRRGYQQEPGTRKEVVWVRGGCALCRQWAHRLFNYRREEVSWKPYPQGTRHLVFLVIKSLLLLHAPDSTICLQTVSPTAD